MILVELSSTSHMWMVLSVKIVREGEGREGREKGKGMRERAIGERIKMCPSPQP
jgi:hypothetical protein